MAIVFFPAGYNLERSSQFNFDHGVTVDRLSDGAYSARELSTEAWVTVGARFRYLSLSEKDTLKGFIQNNRFNKIRWTIDGTEYIGTFMGTHTEHMTGPLYDVAFDYYAKEFIE